MLHDKLQLKISVFFLFCYFLYQKLCLGFWSGTKSKNSWKQGMCQWSGLWIWMAHEAGTLWVGPQKRLKKQCCSLPFPLSSFGKLLLSFLYYILWTTYIQCGPSIMSLSSVVHQWCLGRYIGSRYIPFYSFGLIWPKMVQYISTKTSLTVHTVLCTASIYQTTRSHSSTYKPYVSDTLQYSWIHHIIGPDFPGFPLFLFFFYYYSIQVYSESV